VVVRVILITELEQESTGSLVPEDQFMQIQFKSIRSEFRPIELEILHNKLESMKVESDIESHECSHLQSILYV